MSSEHPVSGNLTGQTSVREPYGVPEQQPEVTRFYSRTSNYFDEHPIGADPRDLAGMIASDDLDEALFGVGLMHMWLADQEMSRVFQARADGRSWGWIGERLGRTRQAIWERYRDRTEGTSDG